MRRHPWLAIALIAALAGAGCQASGARRSIAAAEPPLDSTFGDGTAIAEVSPPTTTVTFADRHPLLSKPREYYDNSGTNPFVKTTAATLIGIPAGILGEMRQIVVGRPVERRPY